MMTDAIDPFARSEPLIGTWRRFGETGPVYEIVGYGDPQATDDVVMRVRIVETDERLDYRLASILEDPEAR